ncbi:hypothetical protein [Pseudoalteromonas umbrosa]|uniref:hypothetical protein n=1 Tax=Pseudoalteromonas umbrosa TaxID=3048489 RepID=UPI0024C3C313|nr:hypothetical protein [Pseudoalteromonas sp. B95]MDK1289712.1 hypothetical protein [Pseudoalteromonas sp. B95]
MSLSMDTISLRRLFYFSILLNLSLFFVSLFLLHEIRQCAFSNITRTVLYLMFIELSLTLAQLIARGYFDFNALNPFYSLIIVVCNTLALIALVSYPAKLILRKRGLYSKF